MFYIFLMNSDLFSYIILWPKGIMSNFRPNFSIILLTENITFYHLPHYPILPQQMAQGLAHSKYPISKSWTKYFFKKQQVFSSKRNQRFISHSIVYGSCEIIHANTQHSATYQIFISINVSWCYQQAVLFPVLWCLHHVWNVMHNIIFK